MSLLPLHNLSSRPPPLPSSSFSTSPSLTITIRFTTSDADLSLPILSPSTATATSLKLQIRAHRPSLASRKLRLIHSGKVLPDGPSLTQLLPRHDVGEANIWIHCSVGDPLTLAELATESSPLLVSGDTSASYTTTAQAASTLPQPLGFDRLLTQGFSETEIAALRAQFARLNPNLPVEDVRALEDRWIDESVGQGQDVGGAGGGGMGMAGSGTFEDLFVGTVIGFFWPVCIWLAREEGVFTQRRQYAVFAGVCVNLFFGLVRVFG